jgi:hypothetical protein
MNERFSIRVVPGVTGGVSVRVDLRQRLRGRIHDSHCYAGTHAHYQSF